MGRRLLRAVPQGLALLALLLSLYLLQFNATYRSDDEHILGARTQSLALRGSFAMPQVYGNDRVRQLQAWGDAATEVEPAHSLLAAPLYRLGVELGWGGRGPMFLLNLYATAITGLLVYLSAVALGFGRGAGLLAGLAFGASSMALPYAGTFYRDPLAALFTAAAGLGLALYIGSDADRLRWIGAGLLTLALALGVLSKNSVLALAPAAAAGLAWFHGSAGKPRGRGRWLPWLLAALALAAASALLPATGPLARFSLRYYLDLARHFAGSLGPDLALGVAGPWLSPARSMLLFSPPLLLLFHPAARRRAATPYALAAVSFALLMGLAQALFYRQAWGIGFGWGLRFMLPALPLLAVLTAPGLAALNRAGWRRIALWSLLGLGALIQHAGALVPWHAVYRLWRNSGFDPYQPAALWQPRALQIVPQLRLALTPANWDTSWLRLLRAGNGWGLGPPLLALLLAGLALYLLSRGERRLRSGSIALPALLAACALLAPLFPGQALLVGDPGLADDRQGFHRALAWLEPQLAPDDVVVVDSYATPLWTFMTNRWRRPEPWYALPYELPDPALAGRVHPASETLFRERLAGRGRLWYLTTPEAPDFALQREPAWLDRHGQRLGAWVFEGHVPLQVYLYR